MGKKAQPTQDGSEIQTAESEMRLVRNFGQVQEGSALLIVTCYGDFIAKAKIVIQPGTVNEEVVIHKRANHYFITDLVLIDESWVKSAWILESGDEWRGAKPYRRGNVPNL